MKTTWNRLQYSRIPAHLSNPWRWFSPSLIHMAQPHGCYTRHILPPMFNTIMMLLGKRQRETNCYTPGFQHASQIHGEYWLPLWLTWSNYMDVTPDTSFHQCFIQSWCCLAKGNVKQTAILLASNTLHKYMEIIGCLFGAHGATTWMLHKTYPYTNVQYNHDVTWQKATWNKLLYSWLPTHFTNTWRVLAASLVDMEQPHGCYTRHILPPMSLVIMMLLG